jgi:hypothetical protein
MHQDWFCRSGSPILVRALIALEWKSWLIPDLIFLVLTSKFCASAFHRLFANYCLVRSTRYRQVNRTPGRSREFRQPPELHLWGGRKSISLPFNILTNISTGVLWRYGWTISANALHVPLCEQARLQHPEIKTSTDRILQHDRWWSSRQWRLVQFPVFFLYYLGSDWYGHLTPDSGAMGSYAFFYLAGLYPVPATEQFLLSSPSFSQISFTNPLFKTTTVIKATNFVGNPGNGVGGQVFVQVRRYFLHWSLATTDPNLWLWK